MYIAEVNKAVARLIVCGMSIDSELSKKERESLATTINSLKADYLLSDIGIALEEDDGDLDLFQEGKIITENNLAASEIESIFSLICNIISSDRFISFNEANFLSALSKRLRLPIKNAKEILQKALSTRNGRLEISGKQIDPILHPHLKDLLSFEGAENIIGEVPKDSLEELLQTTKSNYSEEDVKQALIKLGLTSYARPEEAYEALKDLISSTNLSKLAEQGIEYVDAGVKKISEATTAVKIINSFLA